VVSQLVRVALVRPDLVTTAATAAVQAQPDQAVAVEVLAL
jgi:hypothetical protein